VNSNLTHEHGVSLGKSGIQISSLGIGAWSWGARLYWGFGRRYDKNDVRVAFRESIEHGVTFFDTAEAYGRGRSERLLGEFVRESENNPVIATKFFPYPWRIFKGQLIAALKGSLERLGLERVDLYQVHWPSSPRSVEVWADALADAVHNGLARAVGVSNYNQDQMRRAFKVLAERDVVLTSNQVNYSLLDRKIERNGLLKTCREIGITIIAYSPLAQGVLTGKYGPENPPPGIRGLRYNREFLQKTQPLIKQLNKIGEMHGGKSAAQIALNWIMCKGAVPIPGAKSKHQAAENAEAMSFTLSEEQIEELDTASDRIA
jgi:aryl-alcohol dehydrogenase-like predicted oxidoreductase